MNCNHCGNRDGRLCKKYNELIVLIGVEEETLIFCSAAACHLNESLKRKGDA